MKRFKYLLALCLFLMAGVTMAQNPEAAVADMDYYLPDNVTFDSSIPTPQEVIDMHPGEWHVRHDQLVKYMYAVAEASDRISIKEYARTYENRPMLYLTVTSPSNQSNIEQIRKNHVALTDASQSDNLNTEEMPIVLYMGYSIHGNEPSGSNASLVFAYYLAAAQGAEIEEMLNNTVVLLDPSLNPDGLNRFADWANTHKSKNLVADPNNMEQNEEWPGGRTNHYWFDLNRDWMLVQHPESQGRINTLHEWKPNILTDHHEMGTNSTFFFQPGIQSRTHPLTPSQNQKLTMAISEYHAEFFDEDQRLYYSEESFDDFYYGKGSTYPDINGGIGILFEQASSRGHVQESIHGDLKFPFTIKNQFISSLSTLEAAQSLRVDILNYQRQFFKEAANEASRSDIKGYVYGESADQARTYHFTEMLRRHNIKVHELAQNIVSDGESFQAGSSFIVPTDQKQHRFIEALFERRTTFTDSLFYDVSTWTMPYAFNLPFAELESRDYSNNLLGAEVEGMPQFPEGEVVGGESDYAYIFEWDEYYAPRSLYRMLSQGIRAKVAAKPFTAIVEGGAQEFDYGSIMVALGPQQVDRDKIHELARRAAQEDGVTVYAVSSGLTPAGMDLGSNNFENLETPNVAILAGDGTSSYEVGEAWHLLDQRYDMTPTLLSKDRLSYANISRYNVIVMVNGGYGDLSESTVNKIKEWVRNGGTLITTKYANSWAKSQGLANFEYVSSEEEDSTDKEVKPKPYVQQDREQGAQYIGGSIFNAKLDLTHPLGYGYNDDDLTVFRNSTLFMQKAENPYATPLYYTDDALASGYISEENLEKLNGTAAIVVSRLGGGRVITMTDNPNFRAFWFGTNKLFLNAIFFGQTISGSSAN
ncbi:MAG: M14 family metallopeptidase [Balneolaceae bacterium]|nr:M14 family metallopeptidase [Balneolaceae bacterium]